MMFVIRTILTAGLAFLLVWLLPLPWWVVALPAFAVSLMGEKNGWQAWLEGFAGIALLWLGWSLWIHDKSGGILTSRLTEMLRLPFPVLLLLLTSVTGGLVGGMAAATGNHLRVWLSGRKATDGSPLQVDFQEDMRVTEKSVKKS